MTITVTRGYVFQIARVYPSTFEGTHVHEEEEVLRDMTLGSSFDSITQRSSAVLLGSLLGIANRDSEHG